MDRAVVSTSSGCAGLGLQHGVNIWIADTAAGFRARHPDIARKSRLAGAHRLRRPRLTSSEISIGERSANGNSRYNGIGRPGAIGVTPTAPQTFVDEGDGNAPAGQTTAAVAWGTGPTVPTNFNRRLSCAATIGVGAIFTFPRGFGIPISVPSLFGLSQLPQYAMFMQWWMNER